MGAEYKLHGAKQDLLTIRLRGLTGNGQLRVGGQRQITVEQQQWYQRCMLQVGPHHMDVPGRERRFVRAMGMLLGKIVLICGDPQ